MQFRKSILLEDTPTQNLIQPNIKLLRIKEKLEKLKLENPSKFQEII